MATTPVEARPRRSWLKRLGCLTALVVVGSCFLYTFASFDAVPKRAFSRAHEQLRPGLSLPGAAGVLEELIESPGLFEVFQRGPAGERQVLLSRSQSPSERPSADALVARIDRSRPVYVWMSTVNLSGQFTVLLDADGTVREVSKIDGYVK
jgi:hypothetical protein